MDELLVICKLVRMAVFGTEEEIPTGVNWPKLFADSGINGVSAICYEAVKRLPADRQPDFSLMLRWDLSAQGIRESGDVDFVARPGFEACNAFVESLGIEGKSQEKHTSFVYKGIHFENHTLEPTGGYNRIHHRTVKLLRDSMPEAVQRPDGCLELSPVAQAIFIVKHTSQHICYSGGKIALRMLLDIALLLRRYPDILDKWEPGLRKVGLYRFSRAMLNSWAQDSRRSGADICADAHVGSPIFSLPKAIVISGTLQSSDSFLSTSPKCSASGTRKREHCCIGVTNNVPLLGTNWEQEK